MRLISFAKYFVRYSYDFYITSHNNNLKIHECHKRFAYIIFYFVNFFPYLYKDFINKICRNFVADCFSIRYNETTGRTRSSNFIIAFDYPGWLLSERNETQSRDFRAAEKSSIVRVVGSQGKDRNKPLNLQARVGDFKIDVERNLRVCFLKIAKIFFLYCITVIGNNNVRGANSPRSTYTRCTRLMQKDKKRMRMRSC